MSDSPDIRIGDADRTRALDLLGEHFAQGRLTMPEFEDRSARISAATTRGDLDTVFVDLPAGTDTPSTPAIRGTAGGGVAEHWREIVMGLSPLVALVLFFATDTWLWFLLIPAASILLYTVPSRKHD